MLILSRRNNEQIVLPGLGITITILESKANKVSVGIDAPREVQITRPGAKRPSGLEVVRKSEPAQDAGHHDRTKEPDLPAATIGSQIDSMVLAIC